MTTVSNGDIFDVARSEELCSFIVAFLLMDTKTLTGNHSERSLPNFNKFVFRNWYVLLLATFAAELIAHVAHTREHRAYAMQTRAENISW